MNTLDYVPWYFALVCLFPSSSINAEEFYKDGDVIIGALLRVTYHNEDGLCAGGMSHHGLSIVEAMLYAIETINKDKSVLPNVTLGYDIIDICTSRALANKMAFEFVTRNQATKLKYQVNDTSKSFQKYFGVLRKPIAAVVGTGDSSSSVVVASTLNIDDIPQVSPFATSEELSQPYFKTFFRPVPSDGQQAKALADIVDYFKWKYVYVVAVDTSFGRNGVIAFEKEALERGTFCISEVSHFPPSRYQKTIKAIVSRILVSNVKVILLWISKPTSIPFIEEAYKQGITGRTWLAPSSWSEATDLFINKYMQTIGGFIGTTMRNYSINGYFHYLTSLNYSSSRVNNHSWWRDYWMLQQNCKNTLTCDFQNFRITQQRYKDMYYSYLPYVIDSVYAIAHALDAIHRCNGNDCPKTEPFVNTKDVLRYIRNVSFEGVTGKVEFDKNGDSISSAAYDIVNLHPGTAESQLKIIGTWDRGKAPRLKINNNSLYWNNGSSKVPVSVCEEPCRPGYMQTVTVACCWKCIRCPIGFISQIYSSQHCTECPIDKMPDKDQTECIDLPEVNVSFYDGQSIVLLVVATIEIILVIFVLAIGLKYRNTPIVKASNREMSILFLFGTVVGIVSGVIPLARPTPLICYFEYPLHALYYTLCLSILIVKTNRLVQAFQLNLASSRISQICTVKNSEFVMLFFMNLIAIVVVTLWYVLDPPHVHTTMERLKAKHLECYGHEGTLGFALQSTLYAYQLCLAIFCAYYAFKARNLPENFSEARYIAFAMYMQLLCSICYAILQTTVQGIFLADFSSAIILVSSFGFLVCMFAPKVYIILKFPEKNTREYLKASVASHSLQTSRKIVPLGVAMGTAACSDGNTILKEAVGNRQSKVLDGGTMEVTEHTGNSDYNDNGSDEYKCSYNPDGAKEQKSEERCLDKLSDIVVKKQRGLDVLTNEDMLEGNIPDSHEMNTWRHEIKTGCQLQPIPKKKEHQNKNGNSSFQRVTFLELKIQPNLEDK